MKNDRSVDCGKALGIEHMLTADIMIAVSTIFVLLWLWVVTP